MPLRRPRITASMCAYGRGLAEPKLSPDGSSIAFVSTVAGRGQLVVAALGGGPELVVSSDPPPRPAHAYGGGSFDWTPDGAGLVYAGTDGGLWWVAATGGPSVAVLASSSAGTAGAPVVAPDGTSVAYVVDQHHVAVVDLDPMAPRPSWPQPLSGGADFCFDPVWSPDGDWVAWQEWDVPSMPWDDSRVALRAVAHAGLRGAPEIVFGGAGVQAQQPRFAPGGERLAFLCDASGWLNLWVADIHEGVAKPAQPLLEEPFEHGTASWGLGQRSFAWSPDGCAIAFTRNEGGFGRLLTLDIASGAVTELGKGVHGGLSWVGSCIGAVRSGARTPSEVVVYDEGLARRGVARGPVGGFEAAELVEPEPVDWAGDDGFVVHGRLYRPSVEPATGAGSLAPLLVWVHGGPTDQWPVTFLPRIAHFVERGWAVLVADHRGSTGWGRAYTQAMAGRWGELDVADVAAGMRAAAAQGWCDARRMVPIGGSAGGFTVLNLLARHPELCAAGVDLFGVTDLLDLDETTHRFEAHYLHSVVGPLPAAAATYLERSPVTVAERILSPLLILQGEADPVVPPAQSRAIAERLQRLGRTVELHLYEGEGHGWGRPETVVDELTRIESFLTRHVLRWRAPATDETEEVL
ncbi:MAG: S9 family peptidase [Acidimicrobiales bacterium]